MWSSGRNGPPAAPTRPSSLLPARLTHHPVRATPHALAERADVSSAGDDGHMEFRIAADELKKALYRAQGIVERKTTMPILANVLVNATKSGVTVTAFDLDIGIVSEHPAEVTKPGAVTLWPSTLFDIVQNLPEPQVTLQEAAEQLRRDHRAAARTSRSSAWRPRSTRSCPKEESAPLVQVAGATLLEMIKKTAVRHLHRRDPLHPQRRLLRAARGRQGPHGRHRRPPAGAGRARAGRRLQAQERRHHPAQGPARAQAPARRGARRGVPRSGFAENSALFKKPGLTMVMRLIDGQFPEYQRVIPKEGEKVRDRPQASASSRRSSASRCCRADKSNAVQIGLSDNQLRITRQNPDLGEAKDDVDVALPRRRHHHRLQRPLPDRRALGAGDRRGRLRARGRAQPGRAPRARGPQLHRRGHADAGVVLLERLQIADFRNLEAVSLRPSPHATVVVGHERAGQDQPARGALLPLRRFSPLRAEPALRAGALRDRAGQGHRPLHPRAAPSGRSRSRSRRACGNPSSTARRPRSSRTTSEGCRVVAFTPDDLAVVKGGPEVRRAFLDRAVFNRFPAYLAREPRLRSGAEEPQPAAQGARRRRATSRPTTRPLARTGARVLVRRRALLDELGAPGGRGGRGHLAARRTCGVGYAALHLGAHHPARPRRALESALRQALTERLRAIASAGFTSVGPHADDLQMTLGGRSARAYASQGQERALVLGVEDRRDRERLAPRSGGRRCCCSTTSRASWTPSATPS